MYGNDILLPAGEERNIEDIPAKDLNLHMPCFFMEIKKKDGDQYKPTTLTSFHRSLQWYLNDHGSTPNILKDQQFSLSREALSSRKRQLLRNFGKGNRLQATHPLSDAEEDLMFEGGEFGDQDSEVLQRTVWLLLSLHLGFWACDESRKLEWGDVKLQINAETGNEKLVWTALRGSKCRNGKGPGRPFCPIAQASNNAHCPVFFYKVFRSHRPTEMSNQESLSTWQYENQVIQCGIWMLHLERILLESSCSYAVRCKNCALCDKSTQFGRKDRF